MKKAILFFTIALTLTLLGCSKEAKNNENAAPYVSAEPMNQTDGSTLTTSTAPNGIKSEVRFFPIGEVVQVSRASWPDGRRVATVIFRDGRSVDLQDPADTEQVITASNEAIAALALKVMGTTGAPIKTLEAKPAGGQKGATTKDKK
ncbi:MAG: hypothetical protein HY231_09440 [Acidobacteria bacterium]|nr:hypothetical protein [Acidobacteriota bacterium]